MISCKENADETLKQHAQTSQDLDIFTNRRTVNAFDERMKVCVGVTPTKIGVAAQGEHREGIADTKSITDSNPPSGVSNPVRNQTEAIQDVDCIGTAELETTEVQHISKPWWLPPKTTRMKDSDSTKKHLKKLIYLRILVLIIRLREQSDARMPTIQDQTFRKSDQLFPFMKETVLGF
jgi:hypothetical protein